MLRSLKSLLDWELKAEDGDIGEVVDFYFDEADWKVRYLQVETGIWLTSKKVIISPSALGTPDLHEKSVPISLTRERIRNSPELHSDAELIRANGARVCQHFGWPDQWCRSDGRLLTLAKIEKYGTLAKDGPSGRLEDIIIEDEGWDIKHIVIGTRGLLGGRKVLVPPDWVEEVAHDGRLVRLNVQCDMVKKSPRYIPNHRVNRVSPNTAYDYWGRG